MSLANSIGGCMNRKTVLLIVFWYSVTMLIGAFYYSHLRWTQETNLSRVLYNSIYVPTMATVTRRPLPKVNATPTVPPFNHLVLRRERKFELGKSSKWKHYKDGKETEKSRDSNIPRKYKLSLGKPLSGWPVDNISSSGNNIITQGFQRTSKNESDFKEELRTSSKSLQKQLLESLDKNISILNNSRTNISLEGGMNVEELLGPQSKNSSFIIAAIEENMQKIRRETEMSLQRLAELSGYLTHQDVKNISMLRDSGLLQKTVMDTSHLHHNLSAQTDLIKNLTRLVHSNSGGKSSELEDLKMKLEADEILQAKEILELLKRNSTLERLRLKYEAERNKAGVKRGPSLINVLQQGSRYRGANGLPLKGSITREVAEMIGLSPPEEEALPVSADPDEINGYYLIETRKKLHLQCSSCSVVSSSGQLLNSSAGSVIDSYPCVIRMNSAPITGFEKDVGVRTTARVMGHVNLLKTNESLSEQQEIFINSTRTERMIIPWLFNVKTNKRRDKYYDVAKNFSEVYPHLEFYILSATKMSEAEAIFERETGISRSDAKTWLSTGFMTILFALDVCEKIDLFGLVPENFCNENPNVSTPYHYYESDGKLECEYYKESEERLKYGHLFVTEKAIFARWSKRYNINFLYPKWNTTDLDKVNTSAPLDTPFLKLYHEAQLNKSKAKSKKANFMGMRAKVRKVPVVIGPKTKEDTEKEKYQKFTHAVMFIVAIFLSLVVFLLLFLLASLFVFCFYI